jgi:cytochrome P450
VDLTSRTLFPIDPDVDPVEEARQLRALGPLVPVALPGNVPAWAATDLATAHEVLGHELLTKDAAHWPALQNGSVPGDWDLIPLVQGASMLHQGGADHRRLRRLVSRAFSRAPIEAMRPRIVEIADELLDGLEASQTKEPLDLREAFAFPLPVRVICEVLGVPESAVSELRHRFDRLVTPEKEDNRTVDIRVAVADIYETLGTLIAAKRAAPGSDLTSALIEARDQRDRLSEQELVETLFLILIAGHETTINLITNTAQALLQNRAMLLATLSAEDPDEAWSDVVEEGLRYVSPTRHALLRYAVADINIAGVRVRKGDPVMVALAAAGRDPDRHSEADAFDVTRPTNREHVAFGYGPHYCLGARLAKIETEVALRGLFERFPDLALASAPVRLRSISIQGVESLPVHLLGGRATD